MPALLDVFPQVMQNLVLQRISQVLTFPGLIGAIVDTATAGPGDSERAMGYETPWAEEQGS